MSESQHTPGPWRARATEGYDDDACFAVVEVDSPDDQDEIVSIADLPGLEPYASGEGQANARLIAAAPCMLEALYAALNVEGPAMVGGKAVHKGLDVRWHFDKIRAAIAKATGAEPGETRSE